MISFFLLQCNPGQQFGLIVPHFVPLDLQDFSVAKKEWPLNFFATMNFAEGLRRSTHSIEIENKKRIKSKRDRHFIDFVDLFVYFDE